VEGEKQMTKAELKYYVGKQVYWIDQEWYSSTKNRYAPIVRRGTLLPNDEYDWDARDLFFVKDDDNFQTACIAGLSLWPSSISALCEAIEDWTGVILKSQIEMNQASKNREYYMNLLIEEVKKRDVSGVSSTPPVCPEP
jgi:hypothetical protein